MNVQDFVEKVVRGAKDGAKAAMGEEAPQVRVVFDLQLQAVNEQVDVCEHEILPKAHIEVDSPNVWGMAEEPLVGNEPMMLTPKDLEEPPEQVVDEAPTDEDLLQRLPAMFRKANGEPPTDADCARLVRLLRKPRSKP